MDIDFSPSESPPFSGAFHLKLGSLFKYDESNIPAERE